MEYYIVDKEGKTQAILQNAISISWKPRYTESGKAEIHVNNSTQENIENLKIGNRVVCKTRAEIMYIDYVHYEGSEIIVRGYLDNLGDRINTNTMTINNVSSLVDLVDNNKRGLDISCVNSISKSVQPLETTYQTLRETFKKVCGIANVGYREVVKSGKLNQLEFYEGGRKNVRFSDSLGNIIDQEMTKDLNEYGNYLYVYGCEQDGIRKHIELNHTNGEPRKEVYIDARDLQQKTDKINLTDSEYETQLRARGEQKYQELLSKAIGYKFTIAVDDQRSLLGRDFDLGDVVPVISTRFGLRNMVRVSGINFMEELGKTKITLELTIEEMEILKTWKN